MGTASGVQGAKNTYDSRLVVTEQAREFNARWTLPFRVSCLFRYPQGSSLRILLHAFGRHGVRRRLNGEVLEYGFGHGHGLFWFGHSAALHGIEISESAIAAAQQKAHKGGYAHAEFKKPPDDDPIRIDYAANSFDIVVCSHTIEHVYDDARLISELCRVLKPGGKCFLLVPQDVYQAGLLNEKERQRPDFPKETTHVWRYNLDSFLHLVRSAGFRDLEARSLDGFWSQRESLWRPFQIMCSFVFVALPYGIWEWVDRHSLARGYEPKQILVVATKGPVH